ncbi:MAG: MarR family winged helix-turn-helix transcriptional regulator [Planctomycetota bacterium]|nr:MarR family winged helix-turn-helix transcriptional regulator [Planctomycetota bacterium]
MPGPSSPREPSQIAERIPCMCAAMRRATRAVSRLYDEHISASGVRGTQHTLLRVLEAAGPLRQQDVADLMNADAATLSRTLRPLEREGWLTSEVGDEDKRERRWSITPKGRRAVARSIEPWERAQSRLRSAFTAEEWSTLRRLLDKAAAAADQPA